jgi:RNA polymerase sigma-70 factor (ECF subfamily)
MGDGLADLEHLVDGLRRGDPEAFEALVRRAQHRINGIALRMLGNAAEAEEVAQEVFLRVHRSAREFRGESKLSTWLYAIASRLCLARLSRPERRARVAAPEALADIPDAGPDPSTGIESAELKSALERCIAELDDDRRVVVVLRDIHGLPYEEIAAALGIELGTVRSRLHRARAELKDRLEKLLP